MTKDTFNFIVKGGAATAGPPIGPALAGKGINIGQIVKDINEKTSDLKGMDVPVKVTVDAEKKIYEIFVGVPPTSALLKKEAGVEKGSGSAGTKPAGALKIEHVIKIAKAKSVGMLGKNLKARVKEILGTCISLGLKVEGKSSKEVLKEVSAGVYDSKIKAEKTELTAEEIEQWQAEKQAVAKELEQIEKAAAAAAAQEAAPAASAEAASPTGASEAKKEKPEKK